MTPRKARRVELSTPQKIHFLGPPQPLHQYMTPLLTSMGHQVTGPLEGKEMPIPDRTTIAIGGLALPLDHPDAVRAKALGIGPYFRWEINQNIKDFHRASIAVAGTSGKTTTTLMTALVLGTRFDPTYSLDSPIAGGEPGAQFGDGSIWVGETHEDAEVQKGLWSHVILTNVATDHHREVGGIEKLHVLFEDYLRNGVKPGGIRLVCADNPSAVQIASRVGSYFTYGTSPRADYKIENIRLATTSVTFDIVGPDESIKNVFVPKPGIHIARNATAALVMGKIFGIPFHEGANRLMKFPGAERRYQNYGKHKETTIIDDFANNPQEVSATVNATKSGRNDGSYKRIVTVMYCGKNWQEHLYDFADSLEGVDVAIACDTSHNLMSGESRAVDLVRELKKRGQHAIVVPSEDVQNELCRNIIQPGDVVLTLGALAKGLAQKISNDLSKPIETALTPNAAHSLTLNELSYADSGQ